MGEISSTHKPDVAKIARRVINEIGYDDGSKGFDGNTCAVLVALDEQSPDIAMGVDKSLELKGGEEVIMFPAAVLTKDGYKTFEEKKPLGKDCYGSGHEKLIADFYECVREHKPFAVDFAEASKVVKLFTALYRSNGQKTNI